MAKGNRKWVIYTADLHGDRFGTPDMATQVPEELAVGGNVFGWLLVADAGASVDTLDKRVTPRHVVGVDETGYRARAIVAKTDADLWTGIASQWLDSKGTLFVVTGYVGEKRTRAR